MLKVLKYVLPALELLGGLFLIIRMKMWLEGLIAILLVIPTYYLLHLMGLGMSQGAALAKMLKDVMTFAASTLYFLFRPWLWFKVAAMWLRFPLDWMTKGWDEATYNFSNASFEAMTSGGTRSGQTEDGFWFSATRANSL